MASTDDYLLGHSAREWNRLEEQHALWGPVLLHDLRSLGLAPGQRVLEVGCGTGTLLDDLATEVGPSGEAAGLELDPASVEVARDRVGSRATVRAGDLRESDLGGPWDVIVARWVFSFLPDPVAAAERLLGALAPGGVLAVFDYNHDALQVWPRDPAIDQVIEAYRAAYGASGGDLWVGATLPGALRRLGVDDVQAHPHVMAGPPGSAVWRWVERFVWEHLSTLREHGLWTDAQHAALEAAWTRAAADDSSTLFSPVLVTVSGRRPREE